MGKRQNYDRDIRFLEDVEEFDLEFELEWETVNQTFFDFEPKYHTSSKYSGNTNTVKYPIVLGEPKWDATAYWERWDREESVFNSRIGRPLHRRTIFDQIGDWVENKINDMWLDFVADKYFTFEELSKNETEFLIEHEDRNSDFAVIAPHGGTIEHMTTELTKAVAGDDLNWYSFTGLKWGIASKDLHITSHNFNEPNGIKMAKGSSAAATIHGCIGLEQKVYLDGANRVLWDALTYAFEKAGFVTERHWSHRINGTGAGNICNLGRNGGVQIELPWGLRKRMQFDSALFDRFVVAMREGIARYQVLDSFIGQFTRRVSKMAETAPGRNFMKRMMDDGMRMTREPISNLRWSRPLYSRNGRRNNGRRIKTVQ